MLVGAAAATGKHSAKRAKLVFVDHADPILEQKTQKSRRIKQMASVGLRPIGLRIVLKKLRTFRAKSADRNGDKPSRFMPSLGYQGFRLSIKLLRVQSEKCTEFTLLHAKL